MKARPVMDLDPMRETSIVGRAARRVLDVAEAKTDSLAWLGIALADIPQDPNNYARAIRKTVDKIAQSFPNAQP